MSKKSEMYAQFRSEYYRCWACGFDEERSRYKHVYYWAAPVRLECAHILGGISRVHDRRNISLLCTVCHRLAHGDTIRRMDTSVLPTLSLANMLWLKKAHDPDNYDRAFLQSLRSKKLPRALRPNPWFKNAIQHA